MFLDLTKILSVLSVILPLLLSLLSGLNAFKANTLDNLIIFNIKLSNATILLKL